MTPLYYYVLYVYLLDNSNTVFSFYAKYQPTYFPLGLQRIILLNALLRLNNDPGILSMFIAWAQQRTFSPPHSWCMHVQDMFNT